MKCALCGGPMDPKRKRIMGYVHCTARSCVAEWRRRKQEGYSLVLLHKQGLAWVKDTEVKSNSMRRDGGATK